MLFPKFAKLMNELRMLRTKTVYEVAEFAGVSHTYISQIENGKKLPSFKVLFPLVEFLNLTLNEDGTGGESEENLKLLGIYAGYKNLSKQELTDKYKKYILSKNTGRLSEISYLFEENRENRVKINNNTGELAVIDLPYFDLHWLVTQNKYKVLYGGKYDINQTPNGSVKLSTYQKFNVLPKEDLNTIHDLIEAYLSNKYGKLSDFNFKEGD